MKRLAIILLLFFALSVNTFAVDVFERQASAIGADRLEEQLPDNAKHLLKGLDTMNGGNVWNKFTVILQRALTESETVLLSAIRYAGKMLLVVLLCAVVGNLAKNISKRAVIFAGAAAISVLCFSDFKACIQTGIDAIEELDSFTKLLLPVMAGALAASGGVTSASGLYSLSALFFQFLISAIKKIVVPMISILLAVSTAQCVTEGGSIGRFRGLLSSAIKNALRVMTFGFSAFLSLTGIISGKADAMAMKATKLAAGTVVPVVGGMISDASETILVSAGFLRDSVGIFGMFSVLSILILPFLKIAIHYVVLQIFTLLCSFVGLSEHTALVSAVTSAVGLLTGVTCCCGVFAFVACICFMKVGVT